MFLNIAYITKVNIASLNGSESSGGNIVEIKKISDYEGEEYVYVSGQALRRYLKETLMQLGEKISGVDENGNPQIEGIENLNKTLKDESKRKIFELVIDLDLFGYMLPKGDRRWSVVKVAPLLSLLPYKGEYDYLTRKQKSDESRSGNIVQVEIDTLNYMRGNIVIDYEKIGMDVDEYTYKSAEILDKEERNRRLNKLLDAIRYFNGGAKQARHMEDISPKLVVVAHQRTGTPFMLNALSVDERGNIDVGRLKEALEEFKPQEYRIGITKGIFANEDEIRQSFENVGSVSEAFEHYKDLLKRDADAPSSL